MSHEDLLNSRTSSFHYTELESRCEYAVTDESHCTLSKRPKMTFGKHEAFFMNLVPRSSCFFFSSGPKNDLSPSHCAKSVQQQQTHKTKMKFLSQHGSIGSEKSDTLQKLVAGQPEPDPQKKKKKKKNCSNII
jgi:hypothetical protein